MTPLRPDPVHVPPAELDDLARRLDAVRWPAPDDLAAHDGDPASWALGPPPARVRELVDRWRGGYDWRATEAALNTHEQLVTEIDGTHVHVLRARSPHPGALPLVLTHGWPSSPLEHLGLVQALTDPPAIGGDAADAFDVVVPTLPGFGFSGPTTGDWGPARTARAWARLMAELGHDRYAAHGGDWGAAVTRELGVADPQHCLAVHVTAMNGAAADAEEDDGGDPDVARSIAGARRYRDELSGYAVVQSTRPLDVAYALTDSPVGQLAWIAQPFHDWVDPASTIDDDVLLGTVMHYWLTRTAGSSARWYSDGAGTRDRTDPYCPVPLAMAVFPHDLHPPVRARVEAAADLRRWTEMPRGGHFPALEAPDLLVTDLREWFRAFR